MRLRILGSSGTYPALGRPASGYLVDEDGTSLWIDAGPGTFQALLERIEPEALAGVVISHIHADHCSDLFALYHYLAYGRAPAAPLPVFVPTGAAEHLAAFARGNDPAHRLHGALAMRTVDAGAVVEVGALRLTFAAVDHSVPAVAVRVEGRGPALVYSGDTGPCRELTALAAGARLLLCEASYQGASADKPFDHHHTAAEAGETGRAAGVDRLMLTHIPPGLDPTVSVAEAEATFGRAVELAVPGGEAPL